MVRQVRSYSTSAGVRKHPKDQAKTDSSNIRLRSGSAGHRPRPKDVIKDDEEHEPIEVREFLDSFYEFQIFNVMITLSLTLFTTTFFKIDAKKCE